MALCEYVISDDMEYVLLGKIQSDAIERQFGKYRQDCGGTNLITCQNIFQKFKIANARKYLRNLTEEEFEFIIKSTDGGHRCDDCDMEINFDQFYPNDVVLKQNVSESLCYVSGYISSKIPKLKEFLEENDSKLFYLADGSLIDQLNRGPLTQPTDSICEFTVECYKLFCTIHSIKNVQCRNVLIQLFIHMNSITGLLPVRVKKQVGY